MMFTKRLRDGVRRGEITCSVRIWVRPHVKVGMRYRMEEGEIEVDSIEPIGMPDITPQLARASGFLGVLDLLKVAQHGRGQNIYLVRFHFVPAGSGRVGQRRKAAKSEQEPARSQPKASRKAGNKPAENQGKPASGEPKAGASPAGKRQTRRRR